MTGTSNIIAKIWNVYNQLIVMWYVSSGNRVLSPELLFSSKAVTTKFSEFCSVTSTTGAYSIACEHEHSCCVLLARKERFYVKGRWHTWINYDHFQALVGSGKAFATADYMSETPDWAMYGAAEAGFDPVETRMRKPRKHKTKI